MVIHSKTVSENTCTRLWWTTQDETSIICFETTAECNICFALLCFYMSRLKRRRPKLRLSKTGKYELNPIEIRVCFVGQIQLELEQPEYGVAQEDGDVVGLLLHRIPLL